MNSPLRLKTHFVTELSLKATEAEKFINKVRVSATPSIAFNEENPTDWIVTLVVEFRSPPGEIPSSYEGKISFFGQFEVDPAFPEERRPQIVSINGTSILYGAAREMIANITARGPHPMITLPLFSFVPENKKKESGMTSRRSKATIKSES